MTQVPEPPLDIAATPTPLECLDAVGEGTDADLFVKRDDKTGGVAHGNKLRKLEYVLGDAVDSGADTVLTCGGVGSNHCRATALIARRLGLDVSLVLLGEEPVEYDGNYLLSRLAGASVRHVPPENFRGFEPELQEAAESLRDKGHTPYVVPLGGSSPRGTLGYVQAYKELSHQAEERSLSFDRIVVPLGSGGTCAGLLVGAVLKDDVTEIAGVDVTPYGEAYQRQNVLETAEETFDILGLDVSEDIEGRLDVVSGYVGPGYGDPSDEDLQTTVDVGKKEGLVLDTTYTAKAFRHFLDSSDKGTHLFVHTGGSYGAFTETESLTDFLQG